MVPGTGLLTNWNSFKAPVDYSLTNDPRYPVLVSVPVPKKDPLFSTRLMYNSHRFSLDDS